MKRFVKRLSIFLIPVIVFIAVWEYGMSHVQNTYTLKRNQLEAQAPQIQVLALGGSYTLRGVNPDYFSMKGYNVANVEQSLYYDTRITLKYLDKMPSLKVVLIDVAYHSLWYQVIDSKESFRDYFYSDYWGINYPNKKWYDIRRYSKILQYGNTRSWQLALKGFELDLSKRYYNNGWAIRPISQRQMMNDSIGNAIISDAKAKFKEENFYSNMDDLKNLLQELNAHKISPVLYSSPVTMYEYNHMDGKVWKTIDSAMSDLCNTYHCKWYDYHKDPRFTVDDFSDYAHLNTEGAIKFSKIINEEILKQYTPAK